MFPNMFTEDFQPAPTGVFSEFFMPYPCECKTHECKWPDPDKVFVGMCKVVQACDPGMTINPDTGGKMLFKIVT